MAKTPMSDPNLRFLIPGPLSMGRILARAIGYLKPAYTTDQLVLASYRPGDAGLRA
jgi:hypothetical protein